VPADLFESIADSVSDAVAVSDGTGAIVYVNAAFTRLTGRAAADCLGRPITLLGADLARPADRFETILAGPAPIRVEVRVRDLADLPGQPSRTLWLLRDLRERTEIADALRVSEERFRDFAESASDWLWETNADHRFTFVSDRVRRTGGGPHRWLGLTPGEIGADAEERQRWEVHRALFEARVPFRNFVYHRRQPDGSVRHISVNGKPIIDDAGAFLGYRGTASDITAQIAAEAHVTQVNAKLEECIESLAEAFALFGPDDRLLLCNEQFRSLNPAVRDLVVPGVRFLDVVKASLRRRTVPNAVGRERAWLREWVTERRRRRSMVHRKINDRWFQLNYQRLSDGSTVTIGVDITQVIQREETLREARDTAERANRMKSEFLATMSHELRTPLNAILGFSEVMRDGLFGALGTARYRDYVGDIHQSAQHLLDIISDVLDMSKLEAGQMKPQNERLDVGAVLGHCVRLMRERAENRQLRIETGPTDFLPALMADQRLVKQIVLNLLSNAIKFTEPTGQVRVDCAVGAEGLSIAVTDTGIGIAARDIPRALTPFQQIEDPMSRRFDGTGLGLPIVKAIMDLHGGTITLSSTPGKGTRVTILFPPSRLIVDRAALKPPPAETETGTESETGTATETETKTETKTGAAKATRRPGPRSSRRGTRATTVS
jgi:PAS domain S-box-containing protein